MKTIILHSNSLNERGCSVVLYDYAKYIREYLNFDPIICYNLTFDNNNEVVENFKKHFDVIGYGTFSEIQTFIDRKNIDYFYAIKYGTKDGIEVQNSKNLIHSVFCSDTNEIHGDVYAVVSEWMSRKSGYKIPYVPHMLNLSGHNDNFRKELGIPETDIVVGRYGGPDTFNIEFVKEVINQTLETKNNIWFLFLNTPNFNNHHRCLYFNPIIDLYYKEKFINTCDAFLHARDYGETFGLSVLEFAAKNKQIISYDNEELQNTHPLGGRNHFLYLKDNCFKYQDKLSLTNILLNISKNNPFNTTYLNDMFSSKNVMTKFEKVFLK